MGWTFKHTGKRTTQLGDEMGVGHLVRRQTNVLHDAWLQQRRSIRAQRNINPHEDLDFPMAWRETTLAPIFKKGDPRNPANYRPIALLSHV